MTALGGVIKGTWLGSALAVAVCATTYGFSYPPYLAITASTVVLIASLMVVAREASLHEGPWGALLASISFSGAAPAVVAVSLFAATRPIIRNLCADGEVCYPTLGTILSVGAGFTIVPLLVSTAVVAFVARRRAMRIAHLVPLLGMGGLLVASAVAVTAVERGIRHPTTESYVAGVPELGHVDGETITIIQPGSDPPSAPSGALLGAKWSTGTWGSAARPCHLAIANGGYDIPALSVAGNQAVCPNVLVRQDVSRGLVIVETRSANGKFQPSFDVDTKNGGTSGPLYAMGYELPNVAPSRLWIIGAAAGVLAAIALVIARARSERALLARWRSAPVGKHTGDGWVAFEDDAAPPVHIPNAGELPKGEVSVLGATKAASSDYRSTGAESTTSSLVAGRLSSIEEESRARSAATIGILGLAAFVAATPVAAGLFALFQ